GLAALDRKRLREDVVSEELRAIERRRLLELERRVKDERRGERDFGIREAASEPEETAPLDELDLRLARRETAAARGFHRDTVEHAELDELLELDSGHDALVHEDRERALSDEL